MTLSVTHGTSTVIPELAFTNGENNSGYGQTVTINKSYLNNTGADLSTVKITFTFKIRNSHQLLEHVLRNINITKTHAKVNLTKDQFLLYVNPDNYLE